MDVISFDKEMENIKENFEKIKDKINQNEKSYTLNNGTSKLELDIKHMVDNLSSNKINNRNKTNIISKNSIKRNKQKISNSSKMGKNN